MPQLIRYIDVYPSDIRDLFDEMDTDDQAALISTIANGFVELDNDEKLEILFQMPSSEIAAVMKMAQFMEANQ